MLMRSGKRGWPRISYATACLLALAMVLAALLRTAWVGDDALITFRIVDNFVNGYGIRWNPHERVQAFSHPLWFFVLSGAYGVTGEMYFTAVALSIVCSVLAVALLLTGARLRWWGGAIIFGVLLTSSKAFIEYGTSGLEWPLLYLFAGLIIVGGVEKECSPHQRMVLCATFGLLALTRIDAALVAMPLLVWTVIKEAQSWKERVSLSLIAAIPVTMWMSFSALYFGSFTPNTALAKLNTSIPWEERLRRGWQYTERLYEWDPISCLIIVIGLSVLLRGTIRRRLLAMGCVLTWLYVFWIGGDFMAGRFFAVPVLIGAWAVSEWMPRSARHAATVVIGALSIAWLSPLSPIRSNAEYPPISVEGLRREGIADERAFFFQDRGLLSSGFSRATGHSVPYQNCASGRAPQFMILGAIGAHGWWNCRHTIIIDANALADPLLARLRSRSPIALPGHFGRELPIGYRGSVIRGKNLIQHPSLKEFYGILREVVSGPMWSTRRLTMAALLAVGYYDSLLNDYESRRFDEGSFELFARSAPLELRWSDPLVEQIGWVPLVVPVPDPGRVGSVSLGLIGGGPVRVGFRYGALTITSVELSRESFPPSLVTVERVFPRPDHVWDSVVIEKSGDYFAGISHIKVERRD